ncbi:MAG: hypothetical protein AVDCRST_MAG88-2213, partial [uncultured Thermomicrobiales bacterium]
ASRNPLRQFHPPGWPRSHRPDTRRDRQGGERQL